ncbi:MAG TPA: hypothetical protein VKR55_32025 [Bradyrhizobium sp.]|uniref:hypothetical protein n=1 Tax=Bradyrhizobium sp. TaxID=376 RepID=UPI002B733139|nr:hypothetical protein [Bradyrhizobium sp.]HLZ06762.1 hypothetical protein [Bradyrhizobium sp.]
MKFEGRLKRRDERGVNAPEPWLRAQSGRAHETRVCRAVDLRFTVRPWQTDNHRRNGTASHAPARVLGTTTILGKGNAGHDLLRLERGRRRTRQDQIPPGKKAAGEIADLERSAPNEENLFLLPDRLSRKRERFLKFDPAV